MAQSSAGSWGTSVTGGAGGGADHGPPARVDTTVRKLLPAVVQAGGENPERLNGDQALQSPSHSLRPGGRARGGERRGEGRAPTTEGNLGPGGAVAQHQGSPVCPGAIGSPELRPTPRARVWNGSWPGCPGRSMEEQEQANGNRRAKAPRTWRTRKDPFEGVWCDVLSWLQDDPDASAVALLNQLRAVDPDRSSRAHLSMLQRRVQRRRSIMANKLVYASSEQTMPDPDEMPAIVLAGSNSRC